MKSLMLSMTLLFSIAAWSGPAVLFDEVEVPSTTTESQASAPRKRSTQTEIKPLSQRTSLKSIYQGQEFDSNDEMRAKRRVGLGLQTAGNIGLFGALIELNLNEANSAITAFGGGPGFNALNFQWKYNFGGRSFSPYAGIGYARWYSASGSEGNIKKTNPSVLSSRFLTAEQKRTGEFTVDLITPNIGIQYNQLSGEYTGLGFFGEIDFLTQIPNPSPTATAGLGVLYYF